MSALKQLTELEYQTRYEGKTIPEYARHKKKYSDRSANGLTKAIIDWLKLNGWQAERINVTGRPLDKTQVVQNTLGQKYRIGSIEWLPSTGQKGSADISATIRGQSVKIEVKMKDRQSEAQKEYQRQVEAAGGQYWLVRSFDEFMTLYKEKTPEGIRGREH